MFKAALFFLSGFLCAGAAAAYFFFIPAGTITASDAPAGSIPISFTQSDFAPFKTTALTNGYRLIEEGLKRYNREVTVAFSAQPQISGNRCTERLLLPYEAYCTHEELGAGSGGMESRFVISAPIHGIWVTIEERSQSELPQHHFGLAVALLRQIH